MESMGGYMQTTRYPLWKSVLWFFGILVYGLGAAALAAYAAWNMYISVPQYGYACIAGSLWAGLLAVGAWQLSTLRHKTAGRILAVMAVIAFVLSLYVVNQISATGKWLPGYLGWPAPYRVRLNCDDFGSGACVGAMATWTAEAPHPPDWLPWGH